MKPQAYSREVNDMAKDGKGKEITYVQLIGGYYIAVDKMSYEVRKTMNKTYRTIGYYGSLEKAITACKADYARDEILQNEKLSMEDAVSIIVRANNRFESLVKNAFEGVAV